MVLYSIILFLAALPMVIISVCIYQGKTHLIHDYHQKNVTDKTAYGKAFGKAMLAVSMAPLLSGIIGLCGNTETIATASIAVLFIGLCIGITWIIAVQKKYNKSIF